MEAVETTCTEMAEKNNLTQKTERSVEAVAAASVVAVVVLVAFAFVTVVAVALALS